MAIVRTDDKHYKDIADAIRSTGIMASSFKPETMAGAIKFVTNLSYQEGYQNGEGVGYERGDADGFERGNAMGYSNGYDEGYKGGLEAGKESYIEELLPYNQNLQHAVFGIPTGRTDKEVMEQAATDIETIEAKIEEKGVKVDSLTPSSAYPEKIDEVYSKGHSSGFDEGYAKGDKDGQNLGFNIGLYQGFTEGKEAGLTEGKDEVYTQIEPINVQLENTLNGMDTGGKSFYDLVYQDITITQDCTNAEQLAEIFNAVVGEDEEMVMFINQNWTSYPNSSTPNNAILNAMIYSSKYRDEESIVRSGYFMRWRDGVFGAVAFLNTLYDVNVKAGDIFRKVVLRWKNI